MTHFLQVATVFVSLFLLHSTVGQHAGTGFTKEPNKVYVSLGSDATFHWKFKFGDFQDWTHFEEIVWGKTDNSKHLRNKYVTVFKDKSIKKNNDLSNSLKSRLGVTTANVSQHECNVVFLLRNVTNSDVLTTYGCTAKVNGDDFRSGPISLVFAVPPKLTKRSNATIDKEDGDNVNLQCEATGDPSPFIKWTKDDTLVQSGNATTALLIPNIELKDAGSYVCTAVNQGGSVSYRVQVRVLRYRPHINITVSSNSLEKSWLNRVTSLKCAVYANPTANFTWFKNGRPILDGFNSTHDVSTLTLTPTTASNFGLYSCKATNIKGHAWHNITLGQLYPPRILYVTAVASLLAVNISWNSTNNDTGIKILDYKITVLDTTTLRKQEFAGINISTWYVASLKHNTTYLIKVQARNKVGYGEPTSRNVTTLEADPPGPPVIKVFPRVFSLKVIWNSSHQDINNIKILDYRIKVIGGSNYKQIPEYTAINGTSLIIENLKRNSTYTIELQARNEVGYGETANISATTLLEGPPDAPLITNITVNGSRCILQWTKPYNGENPIQVYTVSVWVLRATNGSEFKERFNAWNTTETNYNLKVEWNQNYTTAVSAWNKYGQSYSSSERHFKTGRFPQELTSTLVTSEALSTVPPVTEEKSSPKKTVAHHTEYPTVTQVKTAESGAEEEEINRHSFSYLAPLWIVILAFAVPAAVFMLWKATQKIIVGHCCKRRPGSGKRKLHNRDSESSATIMDEVKERTDDNHYETITEIVETHFNHGYSIEDVGSSGNDYHKRHNVIPGYDGIYNHLYQKKTGTTKPTKVDAVELESGLGMFPNQAYSHLIHGDSFGDKRPPKVQNRSGLEPSKRHSWEISRDRLKIKATIGRGEFGLVKKGLALNVSQSGGWVPVAVKTLNENEGENNICRKDLLSELKVMKDLSPHKHVVQLLACITKSDPLCVITEFAPYGDLLGFLRKKRGLKDGYYSIDQLPKRSLTSQQLMQFAWEIADGMAYLSSEKIVHRDLAARNILVGENLTCKVTDFGMARDIRGQDMYQKTTGGRLPVKWTAMEALLHGRYTTKSDVWSFGVVLFEIFTIGGCPYPDMEVLELINKLENGYRMEKPMHLSNEVYSLMLSCWNEDPEKRPTFTRLHNTLNQLSSKNQGCINLKAYDGRIYENFQIQSK